MRNPFSSLRRALRSGYFRWIRRTLHSDDGKRAAASSLDGLLAVRPVDLNGLAKISSPYPELGSAHVSPTSLRDDIVIVTTRFRSGSTLLWNLFRQLEGWTAYYEPFNERRWFDPATRGSIVDATHREVSDYWREYEGLTDLAALYRKEWTERRLYMNADAWDPGMKRYIERLVDHAPGRPLLQFNRIDFRLPWIRRQFPHARLIHLYRHPRDQWCSALGDLRRFSPQGTLAQFAEHDRFYLLPWARDLKYHFPFLEMDSASHPYEMFYYIWKLSYLLGVKHADHSLSFESLVTQPALQLREMFDVLGAEVGDLDPLVKIVSAPPPERWRGYADERWFHDIESRCETVLANFLASSASTRTVTVGSDRSESALKVAS